MEGFELWQKVVKHIRNRSEIRSEIRRHELMGHVQRPPTVGKLNEVPMALLKWDNVLREYIEAGGRNPTFEERKGALLNILPAKFKEEVFFRIPAMQESLIGATMEEQDKAYFTLRAQLQKQVDMTIQWASSGSSPGGAQANVLPEGSDASYPSTGIESPAAGEATEQSDYEAFLAWRAKGKGKGKGGKGKGKGKGPICVNCGGKHTLAQCPKPVVPMSERPCWRCGKPGHVAWSCPEKPKSTNSVEEAQDVQTMMMASPSLETTTAKYGTKEASLNQCTRSEHPCECSGGHWTTVRPCRGEKRSKLPATSRLCNSFSALSVSGEESDSPTDEEATPATISWLANKKWEPIPTAGGPELPRNWFPKGLPRENGEGVQSPNSPSEPHLDAAAGAATAANKPYSRPINILESESPEIHVMGSQEYTTFNVVLDSGAADNVVDNAETPGYQLHESAGSKAGSCFIATNGERIPNRGEVRLEMKSGNIPIKSTFQVSRISKPLWSVGRLLRRRLQGGIHQRCSCRHTCSLRQEDRRLRPQPRFVNWSSPTKEPAGCTFSKAGVITPQARCADNASGAITHDAVRPLSNAWERIDEKHHLQKSNQRVTILGEYPVIKKSHTHTGISVRAEGQQ